MAKVTYTVLDRDFNSIPENENYSSADLKLINSYEVNKKYDPTLHYIESHFYSLSNEKIFSVYDYNLPTNNISDGDGQLTSLSIEPEKLSTEYGFVGVDHKIVFHFLNDLYTQNNQKQEFFISNISKDRTEILLYSDNIDTNNLINTTEDLKDKITGRTYFEEFWLNIGNNDLFIVTNVDVYELDDRFTVALKLYEPLPKRIDLKAQCQLVEKVSDSIAVEVQVDVEDDPVIYPKLRQANLDVELDINSPTPTEYFNYDELFSYSNLNSNREIFSYLKENSVAINIDYSDYDNFINFSSAEERLKNFRYKVQLLQTYQTSKDQISNSTNNSGSSANYDNLIKGVIDNFDHYERYLYFESSSYAWPKSTTAKPHTNLHTTSSEVISWYASQLTSASNYDTSNYDVLANTLPSYIAEDPNNNNALLFTHMVGQHFDNLWIYTKATTDKYNNDNRLNYGISKDLVRETLINFGTKIYNSVEGTNDLFKYIIADTYDSGSVNEVVNTFTQVPNIPSDSQPISRKDYEGELYKRIYHNLPFLLKTKGTERGLRALINCFGIPSDYLTIKQYGGEVVGSDKFVGYENEFTSSIDKVRTETRASGSIGNVLTQNTSIQKKEVDRTKDIHRVEVGFSPADSINEYILTQLPSSFNIDDYIGDPRQADQGKYVDLLKEAERALLASTDRPQLNDFIRILKFYDNVLFKMVRDFLPARASVDTGIIIKPHILNRSKAKTPTVTGTQPTYSGSIDTAFITGSDGGAYATVSPEIVKPHQKEIHHKWAPKYVGGISNLNFTPNEIYANLTVNGEFTVKGTKFYHPDGSEYTFEDRHHYILTPFDDAPLTGHDDYYLMFTSESKFNRFNMTWVQQWEHPHIIPISWRESENTWIAYGDQYTAGFPTGGTIESRSLSLVENDCIIAQFGLDINEQQSLSNFAITEFYNYMKPLDTLVAGHKTTIYKEDVRTISGSVTKWVEDESPRYNGELSGSFITVSTGEMNDENVFKKQNPPRLRYRITPVALDAEDLTLFYMYTYLGGGSGSAELACQINGTTSSFYHDGAGTYPVPGDIIYQDSIGTNTLDGNDEWWHVYGANTAILISSSVDPQYEGIVAYSVNCSTFDSEAPTNYSASWDPVPAYLNGSSNLTAVGAKIYGGEIGSTYFASGSLSGTLSSNTATGTISSVTQSISVNVSDLSDGTLTLNVRLADAAGNTGSLATVADFPGASLTKIKDTVAPSGYTVRFTTSNYSTNETSNSTGNFYLKVESINSSDSGTIYYSLQSTGGGTYSNQTNYTGVTFKNIPISVFAHSLGSGTVTATVYLKDFVGNQGSNATDTNAYLAINGEFIGGTSQWFDEFGGTFTEGVAVNPSNLQWVLEFPSWVSVTGASGTGNDSSISFSVGANLGSFRSGTVYLKTTTGQVLDSFGISQIGSGYNP